MDITDIPQSLVSTLGRMGWSRSRSIAGIYDDGVAYHLTTLTGQAYYKSYMRQGLWQETIEDPGQLKSRIPHQQVQHLLQEASPGTVSQLRSILKQVKSQIINKLGRKPINVVVGGPMYLQSQHRFELHSSISALDPNTKVLVTVGQPALATRAFDYRSGSAWAQEHTMLIVDYNHASLDISLATTQRDLPDVLAHTSWPLLGEDFLTMKYASLSFEHPTRRTQHGALHDRALRIREQHDRSSDSQIMSANESSAIESGHVEAITQKLVSMIDEQTYAGEATRGSIPWKPQRGDLSHNLISGDASEQ